MSTDASQEILSRIRETPLEGFIHGSYLQSVGHLMTATAMAVVVDPILQERATAYLWTIRAEPIWQDILTHSGYVEESFGPVEFVYHREKDNKTITLRMINKLSFNFFATHEVCFMTPRACYYLFDKLQ
ncbi:hypothetical protein PMG11_11104 [Penicillium brasilianum]|uniref:Uncharacterized protein n=1 Tax=Penicillium brasilianum TaxID=104259 RepID=A0A0F7U597_PENBI|nr:hypothetical protein PMG11_11104 [Penicillium brasilianum]